MEKRNYTHVEKLLQEIEGMIAAGKTQREVAEQFGFSDGISRAQDVPVL